MMTIMTSEIPDLQLLNSEDFDDELDNQTTP